MGTSTERDERLTPEQAIWAAQVHLAAMATLWESTSDDEKRERIDAILDKFENPQLFAYAVMFVESLGFDVQPLVPVEPPRANESYANPDEANTGFYM